MTPYYEHAGITIYHGDCRDVVDGLCGHFGERPFDLLLTDPPYGIGAAKRKAHSCIRDSAVLPAASWDNERQVEALVMVRALAHEAMIWGGNYYTDVLPPSASWLAWVKPEADTGFSMADMELCWTSGSFAARVKRFPRRDWKGLTRRDTARHPVQKPEGVMLWCLSFFAGSVWDPFMGSGTTLVAAKRLGRRAVGVEIEERYCEIAAKRLSQEALPLEVA